jgi:hypothetical protein
MTVYANKPEINIREKLKELDYGHVPYEKMPAGTVVNVTYWRIPPTSVSTAGTWSYANTPTGAATYSVDDIIIHKKFKNSKIVGVATGHVDTTVSDSSPTVVALTNGAGSGDYDGGTIYGAGYQHIRYKNTEPYHFGFAFEDDMSNQSDPLNPRYYLRTHSSSTTVYFSRAFSGTSPQNPYNIVFWEVMQ